MGFEEEFAVFLHGNGIMRFGDFTLSSGRRSPFYVDLRQVPSYPVEFRRMIKRLQGAVSEDVGLDGLDAWASVPTGGLVIAAALAVETVKPVVYVRDRPKDHGTGRRVEGRITGGMRTVMVDDVATTGGSVIGGIRALRDAGAAVSDAYVVVDRLGGAAQAMADEGVRMHSLTDIVRITEILHQRGKVTQKILEDVRAGSGG